MGSDHAPGTVGGPFSFSISLRQTLAKKRTSSSPESAEPTAKPAEPKETTMEFIASMAVVMVTGLFIVTFNFQAFEIPSSSMFNTLLIGDHLFVDRSGFAPKTSWVGPVVPYRDIQRGDIVVFLSPIEPGLHVVKRIIGVPGDHIHLDKGELYRNGVKVDEPFKIRSGAIAPYIPYRDDFPSVSPQYASGVTPEWAASLANYIEKGDLVVPPGSYFAMGDNRDASYDCRYWGFLPRENIIGRPMFIYWSFDTPEDQYKKTAMSERAAWLAHVAFHFLGDTRWKRTLRLVH